MSRVDPAAAMSALLDGLLAKLYTDFNVAFPCEVLSFDEGKMTASVRPLIRTGTDDPAIIQAVPGLGFRLKPKAGGEATEYVPEYKKGDVVYVVVADREIRNGLAGAVAAPDTARQHDSNDAVIVGIFPASFS
ncbi:Gp138 family membrane-puncturing spike protein [Paenibacillus sp. NRS-1780]|uniref:Gp138 family membrane-puncturing spike protein n=1 Tax=Paenibacillus sp. NRS-1780 TaxID=3233904 RepID=UPI003D26983C